MSHFFDWPAGHPSEYKSNRTTIEESKQKINCRRRYLLSTEVAVNRRVCMWMELCRWQPSQIALRRELIRSTCDGERSAQQTKTKKKLTHCTKVCSVYSERKEKKIHDTCWQWIYCRRWCCCWCCQLTNLKIHPNTREIKWNISQDPFSGCISNTYKYIHYTYLYIFNSCRINIRAFHLIRLMITDRFNWGLLRSYWVFSFSFFLQYRPCRILIYPRTKINRLSSDWWHSRFRIISLVRGGICICFVHGTEMEIGKHNNT